MVQVPLDKELAPPPLNIHIVTKVGPYGAFAILGAFRMINDAYNFIEQSYPNAPKRRVAGLVIYEIPNGEFIEVDTWAVT